MRKIKIWPCVGLLIIWATRIKCIPRVFEELSLICSIELVVRHSGLQNSLDFVTQAMGGNARPCRQESPGAEERYPHIPIYHCPKELSEWRDYHSLLNPEKAQQRFAQISNVLVAESTQEETQLLKFIRKCSEQAHALMELSSPWILENVADAASAENPREEISEHRQHSYDAEAFAAHKFMRHFGYLVYSGDNFHPHQLIFGMVHGKTHRKTNGNSMQNPELDFDACSFSALAINTGLFEQVKNVAKFHEDLKLEQDNVFEAVLGNTSKLHLDAMLENWPYYGSSFVSQVKELVSNIAVTERQNLSGRPYSDADAEKVKESLNNVLIAINSAESILKSSAIVKLKSLKSTLWQTLQNCVEVVAPIRVALDSKEIHSTVLAKLDKYKVQSYMSHVKLKLSQRATQPLEEVSIRIFWEFSYLWTFPCTSAAHFLHSLKANAEFTDRVYSLHSSAKEAESSSSVALADSFRH